VENVMERIESVVVRPNGTHACRRYATRALVALGGVVICSLPWTAAAQTATVCGPEVKAEVAKALSAADGATDADKLALEKALYAKYQFCGIQDAQFVPASFVAAARQCGAAVSNLGSIFYEEMSCAGYDPQRRQFASPIKIKQTFGFGGAPLPGSREHVLHCVADAAGVLRPVGRDSVHLADSPNQAPTWQFAVIAAANDNLQTVYPMDGSTRRARSILSWALTPTDCNYTPIWGNALNYRIRLDR
jgi:hypothetical protein